MRFCWGMIAAALSAGAVQGAAKPELLFRAAFDGTAEATLAKGASAPLAAQGLEYADGIDGKAVRLSSHAQSVLAYADPGNIDHRCGTVSLWVRSERPDGIPSSGFRFLLANAKPEERFGSNELVLWVNGSRLRCDVSDDLDSYVEATGGDLFDGAWHHVAWTWDASQMKMYVDGAPYGNRGDSFSPMRLALKGGGGEYRFSRRQAFDRFFVGSRSGAQRWEGLIDELTVWSAPLSEEEIRRLSLAYGPRPDSRPNYAALCTGPNRYVGPTAARAGEFAPEDLQLVETVTLGSAADVERLRAARRFNSVGSLAYRRLGDTAYLEADAKTGGRFALRFDLPQKRDDFYVFDIDYPDDRVRTADLIFQTAKGASGNYAMQCGVAAGGEYANTGRILTHRTIWWTQPEDPILVAMTARENAPAAVSAVRLYRVRSGRLPVPRIDLPKANGDGWRRTVALYYEDPAIGYDFGVPCEVSTPEALSATIDRTIAVMKFTGENLFAYPGAWYHGLIDMTYNPRTHARDFLSCWYEKFDREDDLSVVPTINVNDMPVPPGLVTLETMTNGALHASPISIHDTGKPNWGGWHGSPPNFNIAHPEVRQWLLGIVDTLVEQGRRHRSFKGVALHVPRHSLVSFGGIESGYNDYCIDAFTRKTGVRIDVDRRDPLRGKAYADWIRARPEVYEKWLDWRCGVVAELWGEMAAHLRAARSDLKLWVCMFGMSNPKHRDWASPEYVTQVNREMGVDGAKLEGVPNLILSQVVYPADPRWRGPGFFKDDTAAWQKMLDYHAQEATYRLLDHTDFPWVGQHDRYWESAIGTGKRHWSSGAGGQTLTSDWMSECSWRVTTINPSGCHALRHFVLPLRYHDLLGVSKGGFLIGTYGMEPHLAKFAAEFRSLPAVKMTEFHRDGNVVARKAPFDGRTYGYVVNTDAEPVRTTVPGYGTFELGPYELKALETR